MSGSLVRYDAARHALQVAHSVDEAKEIRDQASALQAYARQRNDVDMERWVAEIKLRATVRIGEISGSLETHPKAKGGWVIYHDCQPSYQLAMRKQGRFARPEVMFTIDRGGVVGVTPEDRTRKSDAARAWRAARRVV